jgi:hypothetical protein
MVARPTNLHAVEMGCEVIPRREQKVDRAVRAYLELSTPWNATL